MSILSEEFIDEVLKGGRDHEISEAITHEERLRLHSEPTISVPEWNAFNRWLNDTAFNLFNKDKAAIFQALITYPLATVDVTEDSYKELFKVFFAANRVIDYQFVDEDLKLDFTRYLDFLGEPNYWKTWGWEILKNHINGLIVVDLPALERDTTTGEFMQETERPEPYFYFVPTENLILLRNNQQGDCEFAFFYADVKDVTTFNVENEAEISDVVIVLDDQFYRRYVKRNNSDEWELDLEAPHDLGYCPSKQFWSKSLGSSKVQKANPATPVLGELDWLLFSIVMKRHLELYAGFPIMTAWEQKCTYKNAEGFRCEQGWLVRYDPSNNRPEKTNTVCPRCSVGSKIPGPGTLFKIPFPKSKEEDVGMPAVDVTKGDTESLEQMENSIQEKKDAIMARMVGSGGEPSNEQAKNEKQVQGAFESKQVVLENMASNFEAIQGFTIETLAKLRYGSDFLGSVVDYGNQFFMQTSGELQDSYEKDRTNAMPYFELENDRERIYINRYKNNPRKQMRSEMLGELEPLQDLSLEEIDKNKDIISREKRTLKINFNEYIERFERSNGELTSFLEALDMPVRIQVIQQELMGYVAEDLALVGTPEPPSGGDSSDGNGGDDDDGDGGDGGAGGDGDGE